MSSKSSPPPDGLSWREGGQGGARKPQEQSAQLKGVFGEGASVLAVPEASRAGEREQPDEPMPGQAATPEQLQRKAQSRGLWDGGANQPANQPPSQPTQPRAGTLPRAVVGTANPSVANTNFRNPSIGNEVSPPLPAALAASQPLAAGAQQQDGTAAAEEARPRKASTRGRDGRDIRSEADPDTMDTMELDMAKFIQKGGLPQKAPAQPARPQQNLQAAVAAHAAEKAAAAAAAPAAQPAPAAKPAPGPAPTAQAADPTPPSVAAEAALAQPEAAKVGTTTEKLATRPTPSSSNTTVLLALIVVAAIIAVLFIGAALGIWHLPWASSPGHASLSKTVSAKSLPEMRTPAMPATQIIPTAVAAPAAPAEEAQAQPQEPAQEAQAQPQEPAAPSGEAVAVMPADEAAPMHAAANSGGDPEDDTDRPTADVTELLSTARTELRAGHIKEAEALLRPALEKDPNDHHVAEVLAQTLMARGAAVEAVALAQRIVKKRPKSASYRVLLGDALRRAGDEPNAKAAYREALALDPNLRDAHARLSKL